MEPNTQNTMPNNAPAAMPAEHKKVGPIIVGLVVLLILVIVALYMFASSSNVPPEQPANSSTASTQQNAQTNIQATQSVQPVTNTADDPQSLQNDLNASTNGLDNQSI